MMTMALQKAIKEVREGKKHKLHAPLGDRLPRRRTGVRQGREPEKAQGE